MPAEIIHYLDDFLIVLPPDGSPSTYGEQFADLCTQVELQIKETKSEKGSVAAFAGIELDTIQMVIRLRTTKLLKAQNLVKGAIGQTSLSISELQSLTGYLNFVSIVTPLV